jgi:hypothetical protein
LIHGPRRLTVGALLTPRGFLGTLRMTIEAGVRCSFKAAIDPSRPLAYAESGRSTNPDTERPRRAVRKPGIPSNETSLNHVVRAQ